MVEAFPTITINDVDREGESMIVEVMQSSMRTMKLVVPNTTVTFYMNRYDDGSIFKGSLGSREFSFDPRVLDKPKKAVKAAVRGKRVG